MRIHVVVKRERAVEELE
jgi:hypothetical protein